MIKNLYDLILIMTLPCLKVDRSSAERIRKRLMEASLLDREHKVFSEDEHVFIPVKKIILSYDEFRDLDIVEREAEPVIRKPGSYKDVLQLPDEIKNSLPSSFDIIGDVCIMKIPDDLTDYAIDTGKALMKVNRNIRSVALDRGVKGDFRVRDLEVIAGDDHLETVHIENNIRLKLDPSRVYFSPRLATERSRVAAITRGGIVLDMFAGVGPFSINIARWSSPETVIGIDLNPDCIDYFNDNIRLNSCDDIVEAYLGDAAEAPLGMGPFDRIIMNLPHGSIDFLQTALSVMVSGNIHLYTIVDNSMVKDTIVSILEKGNESERVLKVEHIREVHPYSATQSMLAMDISVNPQDS